MRGILEQMVKCSWKEYMGLPLLLGFDSSPIYKTCSSRLYISIQDLLSRLYISIQRGSNLHLLIKWLLSVVGH
jgi:hypothetical protein